MAEEGDGDPLALTGLQHAVQRQDVKDLEEGEIKIWSIRMDAEESPCPWALERGWSSTASAWSEGHGWSVPQTDKTHPNLLLHPLHFPVE